MDDKLGGKPTILVSLVGLVVAALVAVLTTSVFWFWVSGIGVGLLAGPNQSASRSLLGRFTPPKHENEFYGFFAFSGKFTAFLGPFMLGKMTLLFDSIRAGIAVVVLLFIVGGVLLLRVDEKEGVASSGRVLAFLLDILFRVSTTGRRRNPPYPITMLDSKLDAVKRP